MGQVHRFFCLNENNVSYEKYQDYFAIEADLIICHDLIGYIYDSLLWVPSLYLSGAKYKKSFGLFLNGDTIINSEGAAIFRGVIQAWVDLFSQAPEEFELTGTLLLDAEKRSKGEFRKIKVERNAVVENLSTLVRYANKTIDGEYYILHLGI